MNTGGKLEGTTEKENAQNAPNRAGTDEFCRAVSQIAVAQICENIGFHSFNESALEALADITVRYLRDLGKTANFYANLAGRTDCNIFDIIQGLEDLGSSRGFPGASEVSHCSMDSGMVKEIVEYVQSAEEVPFARPVPHFPVTRPQRVIPSFLQMDERPSFKHIPPWLPAFPDPHTYVYSSVWNERVTDARSDKLELARQRRKAERSLLSLQQRLVGNGSAVASTSGNQMEYRNGIENEKSKNPFLARPLQAGVKDVSPVVMPSKLLDEAVLENNASVLETFAPAIEAVKFCTSGDNVEIPTKTDKRPAVCLDFKAGRKILGEPLDLSIRKKGARKVTSLLGRDDEKEDKKRRAELILRQSIENPHDLNQL